MSDQVSVLTLRQMHARGQRIVCVTAYDALFGALADAAGIDVVLVGDSLGNVVFDYETTIPVEMADILHHVRATRMGVKRALLVADLPFGSYQVSPEQAVTNAVALMKAGADAVKLEGAYADAIRAIVAAGIPVMGHVGFTPQSVKAFGGFRVQGRGEDAAGVIREAKSVANAGAFAIVLELIPEALGREITEAVNCPTIGIGAGRYCDGEIQVIPDVLGLSARAHKHATPFADGRTLFTDALARYASAVREREFPTEANAF